MLKRTLFSFGRQRTAPRPLDIDFTHGWSLRDLADLPMQRPQRDAR